MSKYTGPVCRGSWALGTACKRCERCIETKPSEKQDMGVVTDADRDAAASILYCAAPNSFTADGQYKLDMELVAQAFRDHRLASQADQGLLRPVTSSAPAGCYCSDKCMAPVIMGRQQPCRRATHPQPSQKGEGDE